MYKDKPNNPLDSGWRFTSGYEDQEYIGEDTNHAVYDLNTIANYDPEITKFLEASIGTSFERNANGELVKVDD